MTDLDAATLRAALAEAWWRGRQSANARQGEWAGPELRERCEKDILDAVDALTDAAAPRPVAEQRCNGCGHQWTGPAPVVLCGECWRLAWPFVFGGVRCRLEQAEADVARLTEQVREWRAEAEAAGDRARAEAALRREVEAERDAALATATEAAETVARLTAERDAARAQIRHCENCGGDYAVTGLSSTCGCEVRAQVWAEAIAVVGQERERFTKGSDLSTVYAQYSVRDSFDSVLAALRAAQERQG